MLQKPLQNQGQRARCPLAQEVPGKETSPNCHTDSGSRDASCSDILPASPSGSCPWRRLFQLIQGSAEAGSPCQPLRRHSASQLYWACFTQPRSVTGSASPLLEFAVFFQGRGISWTGAAVKAQATFPALLDFQSISQWVPYCSSRCCCPYPPPLHHRTGQIEGSATFGKINL